MFLMHQMRMAVRFALIRTKTSRAGFRHVTLLLARRRRVGLSSAAFMYAIDFALPSSDWITLLLLSPY
jgi:hypothetical protein